MEFDISSASKSDAMKFEAHIKKLSKKEKEDLLKGQTRALDELGLDYEIGLIVE